LEPFDQGSIVQGKRKVAEIGIAKVKPITRRTDDDQVLPFFRPDISRAYDLEIWEATMLFSPRSQISGDCYHPLDIPEPKLPWRARVQRFERLCGSVSQPKSPITVSPLLLADVEVLVLFR
jgi:hypothetical protein